MAVGCTGKSATTGHGDESVSGVTPLVHGLPLRTLGTAETTKQAPPFSLTASDGTGLKLVELKARGVVEEPVAFTELHMTFENPTDRQIEGRFTIDMPPGAAISRFAMKIHSRWQEGEVVERQAARVAYEDFLHRKQDPALLENQAGNQFSARVFPIQPNERKELILSYSQELDSSAEPYRLELEGLPQLEQLDARVVIHEPAQSGGAAGLGGTTMTQRVVELKKFSYTPEADLEVSASKSAAAAPGAAGIHHKNLALARVKAVSAALPPAPMERLTILFDTSASRALGFERQLRRLGQLVDTLEAAKGSGFELEVVCFDQGLADVYRGPSAGFGTQHLEQILSRRAFGASDLAGALRGLAARSNSDGTPRRLLIVSDGISTAGSATINEAAVELGVQGGYQRIDALIDGGLQDRDVLVGVTTALDADGIVVDARTPLPEIGDKLLKATLSGVEVSVPGSKWAWPRTLDGVQPGDEVLVYADLTPIHEETPTPGEFSSMTVNLSAGGKTDSSKINLVEVERPLIERAWVGAKIDQLTYNRAQLLSDKPADASASREQPGELERLKQEIVDLSIKHRVLSDFTALLVLETEWDYQRFNIDRNALSDIMTVGTDGVELLRRSADSAAPEKVALPRWPESSSAPGDSGVRHKGEEGKSGLYAMKGPDDPVPQMARNFDPDMAARNAGILGVMQQESGHFIASPYGGAFAVGNDDEDVWGGLTGTEVGDAYGVGGLGLVGTGRGGGGTGESTIGLGNTGLIGKGGGGGSGSGYGRGSGAGFGGRGKRVPMVRQAKAQVNGALDKDIIRRIVRAHINEVRHCYNAGLTKNPSLQGRVAINFVITGTGTVGSSVVQETTLKDASVGNCVAKAVKRWKFPKPQGGGNVVVTYPFVLDPGGGSSAPYVPPPPPKPPTPEELEAERKRQEAERVRQEEQRKIWEAERARQEAEAEARRKLQEEQRRQEEAELERTKGSPYRGQLFDIMNLISEGKHDEALPIALAWHDDQPGDVLALIGVGEALEAKGDRETAARVYGSIIDLFPSRADLRRYAGTRLERLGDPAALQLAADTYKLAVEQRDDHPNSHRFYAYALARAGQHEQAFEAILTGLKREYPADRFRGVDRILQDDAGIIGALWVHADPSKRGDVEQRLQAAGSRLSTVPSLRFIMSWETDSNDVDFHIHDGQGGHAWYASKRLSSGGELYADVTTGYGPECFSIEGKPSAFPYEIKAHYFRRGPMGYGMGALQVIQFDGQGALKFDDRPFIIMKDEAYLELGTIDGPLQ
ncbi:MAG: AgmX/PglI C-terminal domain-containing protein [Myxococcales bacterium]|nr:AgmX/PglI C-terminal domain-containing protein [Myxococcales bacterium]